MHITLESDYAVRIVACLAIYNQRLDAKTISDKTYVTLRFSLKILRKLVAADIVKSYKGTQGGYELNKKPDEISLRDIIEAVEGTYVLNRCLDGNHTCSRGCSGICSYQKAFAEISDAVNVKLEEYTLDKLICNENHEEEK